MRNRLPLALVIAVTAAAAAQELPRLQPQATGTGSITGRVVEAGSHTPVANARLRLHQTRGKTPAGVFPRYEHFTTDSSGAFAFQNLPAGEFSIQANADGYEPGAIGKRRPQGDEAWITLEDGQTFSNATIELFRGGTISGVVTNDRGEPMNDVLIEIWMRTSDGQLRSDRAVRTNAEGIYRITAVPAGDHFIVAGVWHNTTREGPPGSERPSCSPPVPPLPPGVPPPVEIEKPKRAEGEWFVTLPRWIPEPAPDDRGQLRTIPTTFYPSVSDLSRATVVSIRGGDDRTGIDLQFRPTATSTIQGRIVPLRGKTIGKGSEVRLRLPGAPSQTSEHRAWVQPDNTFRFLGVPPGSYVLEMQLQEFSGCHTIVRNSDDVLTQMPLDVPAAGLDDVVVRVASSVLMHGRIRFDGQSARPEYVDIWLTPTFGGDAQSGEWDHDAPFTVRGLIPGGYTLRVSDNAEPPRWFVRSMTFGRFDLATRPVAIDRNTVSGIEVTMTDRASSLDGRVVDATGNVVRDATVVVFPADRASWATAHDRLMGFTSTRSLDGTYRFRHLVPGDYVIAAVDELRMGEWPRAEFLESVAKQAIRLRIGPGETQTLKLIR